MYLSFLNFVSYLHRGKWSEVLADSYFIYGKINDTYTIRNELPLFYSDSLDIGEGEGV